MRKTPLLELDLVPSSSWFNNVRSVVSTEQWNIIRNIVYDKAWHICEICGGVGLRHPVECHEIWEYDDKKMIQKLKGMISLCPKCHMCKHFGFAQIQGKEKEAFHHLMTVNSWDKNKTEKYINNEFKKWKLRSKKRWKIDISFLKEYGIDTESLVQNK